MGARPWGRGRAPGLVRTRPVAAHPAGLPALASPIHSRGWPLPHRLLFRSALLRWLDALLFSSGWLALAAAAQALATLALWAPLAGAGYRMGALVLAATLLVYNLDAVLPFKQLPAAAAGAGRKAWQQRHRRALAALAGLAGAVGAALVGYDGWLRYARWLAPLAALALLYSWPVWPWRGRWRALRDVPLLKGFLIAGVWSAVTVGLPVLLHRPPALRPVALLLGQRFCLVAALAVVFDIRDVGRDRAARLLTWPVWLGVAGARAVALAWLAGALAFGLWRGTGPGIPGITVGLAAAVVLAAREHRHEYFFALLSDGVLLVPAALYLWFG